MPWNSQQPQHTQNFKNALKQHEIESEKLFQNVFQRQPIYLLAKFYKYTTLNKQTDWKIEIVLAVPLGLSLASHSYEARMRTHKFTFPVKSEYAAPAPAATTTEPVAPSHFVYACCDLSARLSSHVFSLCLSLYHQYLLNRQRCLKAKTSKNHTFPYSLCALSYMNVRTKRSHCKWIRFLETVVVVSCTIHTSRLCSHTLSYSIPAL